MANTLTVFFKTIDVEEVEFVLQKEKEGPAVEHGICRIDALSERISTLEAITTVVVLPGEMVTSRAIRIPPGSRKHLEKALPYLLEDDLACSPESIHAAPGSISNSGDTVVLIIENTVLQDLLALFTRYGLRCDRMIPDYLMLPTGDRPRMVCDQDCAIIRQPDGSGMTLPLKALPFPHDDGWEVLGSEKVFHTPTLPPQGFNLLQGAYRQKSARSFFSYLKVTSLVLMLAALLHIGYFFLSGLHFHQKSNAAHLQAEQEYRALFPDEQRVVSVRRQLEGRLIVSNPVRGTDSFLDLLGGLALVTAADPSVLSRIKHLNFNLQRGDLLAEIDVNNLGDLQRLSNQLADQDIAAQVLGAGKTQNSISARVSIKREAKP